MSTSRYIVVEPLTTKELCTRANTAGVTGRLFKIMAKKMQTEIEYHRGDIALAIEWELRTISLTYDDKSHIVAEDVVTGTIIRIDIDTDTNQMKFVTVDA